MQPLQFVLPIFAVIFLLIGIPYVIAERIRKAREAKAAKAALLNPAPPIDHGLRATHMIDVVGPLDLGEMSIANTLHFKYLSEHGSITFSVMQENFGIARKLAADWMADHLAKEAAEATATPPAPEKTTPPS